MMSYVMSCKYASANNVSFIWNADPHKFQLWAYVYQARDLLAMDESGMNGEYYYKVITVDVLSEK